MFVDSKNNLNRHFILKLCTLLFFIVIGMVLGSTQKTEALTLNPDPGASIPSFYRDYLRNCDTYGASPAFSQWVSIAGDPSRTSINVPNGSTAPIALQYNFVGAVCRSNSAVTDTRVSVVGSSPGEVSGIDGRQLSISFGSQYNSVGAYRFASAPFLYNPSVPFTTSQVITITLATKVINRFTSNQFLCVPGPPGNRGNLDNIGGCSPTTPTFGIEVIVPPGNIPLGTLDYADCNVWQGWAFDADNTSASIQVHVYTGAPAGSPGSVFVGAYLANQPRSDVNSAFGISGNHGFTISPPVQYSINNTSVWFYAIGVNNAGVIDGNNSYIGTRSYTGCPPVPASPVVDCSISSLSITAGNAAAPTVTIRHTGPPSAPDVGVNGSFAVQGQPADGVSVGIVNGSQVIRTGTSRTYSSPGVYAITGSFTVSSSVGNTTINCAGTLTVSLPQPIMSCSISPIAVLAGVSAAPTVRIRHNGPPFAPAVTVTGTLIVQTFGADNISASIANGSFVDRTGTARTILAAGTYAITGTFTATSNVAPVNFSCSSTFTVTLPPPNVTCSVTDTSTEEGEPVAVPVRVIHNGPQYAPSVVFGATITIVSQPTQALSGSVANGATTPLATASRTYAPGRYAVAVQVTGSGGGYPVSVSCTGLVTALARPYIRAYGNDVQTGGGYASGNSCSAGTGSIRAFGRGSATNYSGSGTQLAAFARAQISGFRSASMRSDAGLIPYALSFSNTSSVNTAVLAFGGNFASTFCMTEYWSLRSDADTITTQFIDLGALPVSQTGRYYVEQSNPAVPVVITGFVPNGQKVALFIEGDTYVQASTGGRVGYASTVWPTLADIPSLYVVTLGNILVGSDVVGMDGQFIAQNAGVNDGRITTCVNPATMSFYASDAALIAGCRTKLTVFGSFTARHINYLRVFGSQLTATANEPKETSGAAEILQYSFEAMVGEQATPGVRQQTYDSITALPPSL